MKYLLQNHTQNDEVSILFWLGGAGRGYLWLQRLLNTKNTGKVEGLKSKERGIEKYEKGREIGEERGRVRVPSKVSPPLLTEDRQSGGLPG